MINKKNLWFLTLFSLILVLSVYYITMPSELLLTNSSNYVTNTSKNKSKKTKTKATVKVEKSEAITALRVTADEKLNEELATLKVILTDSKATTEEKNKDFEKMKYLFPMQYDVGVDFNDFTPISFKEVKEKIEFQIANNVNLMYWVKS